VRDSFAASESVELAPNGGGRIASESVAGLARITHWRERAYVKALLWWAVLVPAGAVVFFSAAERVHVAKAGAQAERDALPGAAYLVPRLHSPRPKASWTRREPQPTRPEVKSSVVPIAGPSRSGDVGSG
jgi:hypothetical protein